MIRQPVIFEKETHDEMMVKERSFKQSKRQTLTRMAPIVEGLRQMAEKFPELKQEFSKELSEIGV